jgi:hypothetical protein
MIAGKVAYAPSAAGEPAWKTGADGINGQPVLDGDGEDDCLFTSNFVSALTQPFTIWIVATTPASDDGNHDMPLSTRASTDEGFFYAMSVAGNPYYMNLGTAASGGASSAAGTAEFYLITTEYTAGVDKLWVNGVQKISTNCGTSNITRAGIFGRAPSTYSCDSKIAEIGIVKHPVTGYISAEDRALLEAYCEDRYGVVIAYWDGQKTTILCMDDMNMTEEMMIFLTLYNWSPFAGRSRW